MIHLEHVLIALALVLGLAGGFFFARSRTHRKAGGDPDVLFPVRTSPLCSYCDFRRSCPQGRAAAPDAQPWSLLAPCGPSRTGRAGCWVGCAPCPGCSRPAWWCWPRR